MEEEKLLEEIQNNNQQAFRSVVDKYQVQVRNTCFGFVHHTEDAEDLAQEVFLEIYRNIHKFRGDSSLSTWIYRIAVNKSLNFIRNKKRSIWSRLWQSVSEETEQNELISQQSADPDAQQVLENKEQLAAFHKVLDTLPENQKIALVLHTFEELPYKEIASIMDVSLSSVESLIFRAKRSLRNQLFTQFKK